MVFLQKKYDPGVTQAKLQVSLSASPTLSLSDPDTKLKVTLSVRIADAKEPGTPITFRVDRSAFEVSDGLGVDMFARGAFGALRSVDSEGNITDDRRISFGLFRVNEIDRSDALDLRERGCEFLTIPGDGTPATVTHRLDWGRIFKNEEKISKRDLRPGERLRISVNSKYLGTGWWCYGSLDGDLADKKFHPWTTDEFGEERPNADFVRQGNWVLGRDPQQLYWTVSQKDNKAIIEIVE